MTKRNLLPDYDMYFPEEKVWLDKILNIIDIYDSTGCWEYLGATQTSGYGFLRDIDGKPKTAHRAIFEVTKFEHVIEEDMQINHKCDFRKCIRPEHLYEGTHAQNMEDRHNRKGNLRTRRGRTTGRALIIAA